MKKTYIEVYRLTQPKQYCRNYAHTDCIEYIEGTMTDGTDGRNAKKYEKKAVLDRVMDFSEYNCSVEANCSETYTEEDYPQGGIRVIVIEK